MTIAIAILSILILVALHELGHFLLAKRFGVKVEEFGIGLPPRVVGKKIGETIYSLNLLPIGAFVRMEGEEARVASPTSFSVKPVWQRMIIVAAGVIAFWLIAVVLFMILGATSGVPMEVGDEAGAGITNPQVQITGVALQSPAQNAKLLPGDVLKNFTTISEFQKFVSQHKGKETSVEVQRGSNAFAVLVAPRENPPAGEGPLGVALARTAFVKYAWYMAPIEGIKITVQLTARIAAGLWDLLVSLVSWKGLPQGMQISGPIGIVAMLKNALASGPASFFYFLATLSVYLAIFNVIPIPAADGGRLLFLGLELFRKKPISEKLEQKIITISFGVIILLFAYVSIRDITRLFS